MGSPPNFRIDTLEGDSGTTIKLGGELDSASCDELVMRFEEAISTVGRRELVIDLGEVTFIDSSGMRAIIMIERRAGEHGVALTLTRPPAGVTELLQTTGIADRVVLTPSAEDFSPLEPFVERIDITLVRAPDAPARARAELRQAIAGRLSEQDGATATLLTSELVTNAVIHPGLFVGGSVGLRITLFGNRIRVEVTDGGAGFDVATLPPARPGEAGGHGLFVVDGLSSRWGTTRRGGGAGEAFCVWFELDAGLQGEAGDQAAQFSTPSRSQQYSSRHSLASSMHRASESQGSTVSNA
ncbi:MAG TPA: STAS domain-containing protein [Solirubrobacteraceae bacterium]|nr:STAS domain-containing protein [Solirubrobacteraceae bacterium]